MNSPAQAPQNRDYRPLIRLLAELLVADHTKELAEEPEDVENQAPCE